MKKNAIITYLLAVALLLSACVYRIPNNTQGNSEPALQESGTAVPSTDNKQPTKESESAPSTSDTSPTFESTKYSIPTESITYPDEGDTISVGPYIFRYGWIWNYNEKIYGWKLESCKDYVEEAVIPSEVMGISVISIGLSYGSAPPFSENSSLKSISIPNTVLIINFCAFRNCQFLTEIKLSDGVTKLGDDGINSDGINSLLEGTAVTFLDVPEGVVKLMQDVFYNSSLESIVLPLSLEIAEACFTNCPIKKIFYRGTEDQCPQTLLDQVATTEATIYYLSEEEPTEEGNFWHYVDGKPVIW